MALLGRSRKEIPIMNVMTHAGWSRKEITIMNVMAPALVCADEIG